LNCGHPFFGHEKYCPECGQKNKGRQITFVSFVREVFHGFLSLDAKFWNTLIPLLIKPGKVSKDFINGKRTRYTNPFQFYLTTSILFFVIFGAIDSYNRFQELSTGKVAQEASIINVDNKNKDIDVDSIKNVVDTELKKSFIPFDSLQRDRILKEVEKNAKDSTRNANGGNSITFGGSTRFDKFGSFVKDNPDVPVDEALDSLGYEKNFKNRFLYDRAKKSSTIFEDKESRKDFINQMLSYASVSLFVLLPIFTLSLKLFYVRRKFTYVEHLIFVFHTQTVFFLLLIILVILNFFTHNVPFWLFLILFLIYLYLAMKRFYSQGYIKTFIKFILINQVYMFLATIGVSIVAIISFALF